MTTWACFLRACRQRPADAAILIGSVLLCALAMAAVVWAVAAYEARNDDVFIEIGDRNNGET